MSSNLASQLNATVEVDYNITRPAPLTRDQRVTLARRRALVRAQILGCRACPLSDMGWVREPVPFTGPLEPTFAVVGEAPGMMEDRAGRPFVGKSGQALRAMMHEAGVDDASVFYMNTVSCRPAGAPDDRSLHACHHNLDAQLEIANTPFVVLAGNVALWKWREDLTVTKMNGTVFVRGRRVFMPILHPSYVIRRGQWDRGEVVGALEGMRSMVTGDLGVGWFFGRKCAASGCGGWVDHYDAEGVAWCGRHWDTRVPNWTEKLLVERRGREIKAMQAKVRVRRRQQGAM